MSRWLAACAALILVALLALFVTEPVSNTTQLFLAIVAMGGMIACWPLRRIRPARYVFLGLGSIVVLRYLYWRTTHTLPSIAQPADFAAGIVLYGAELFCIMMFFITLFIVADPLRRRSAPFVHEEDLPTIDVFVPSYNEDETLLAMTLAAAKAMDYPAASELQSDAAGHDPRRSQGDGLSGRQDDGLSAR